MSPVEQKLERKRYLFSTWLPREIRMVCIVIYSMDSIMENNDEVIQIMHNCCSTWEQWHCQRTLPKEMLKMLSPLAWCPHVPGVPMLAVVSCPHVETGLMSPCPWCPHVGSGLMSPCRDWPDVPKSLWCPDVGTGLMSPCPWCPHVGSGLMSHVETGLMSPYTWCLHVGSGLIMPPCRHWPDTTRDLGSLLGGSISSLG